MSTKTIETKINTIPIIVDNKLMKESNEESSESVILWLNEHTELILEFFVPIIWCIIFIILMDRQSLLSTLYMPFLGIFAAFLANCVPIGGGIVYVPALTLLGVNIHLGAAFTVATMTFGNGLFGFLRWLNKNPNYIIWESFQYTVIPSWIGSLLAIYFLPVPSLYTVKRLFSIFCFLLASFILTAVYRGGIEKAISSSNNDIYTKNIWITVTIVSFLAGVFLVPYIGIGPAMTTYILLNLHGYDSKSSIVTGIITGGWVCIVPFLIHLIHIQDIPLELWIMVIPGVYIGAKYAPMVHEFVGITYVLSAFAIFLFATAYLFAIN